MRTSITYLIAVGLIGSVSAFGAEKKVKIQDLPPAVQQAVKEQTKKATLIGLTQEVEEGKTVYEVETKVSGRGRDVTIDSSGAVILVEEEVTLDSIPAAARAAIEKQAAGGKITKVETVAKGKNVTYEALVTRKGKPSEISVTADGSPVK
jgi:uncharacterized membrane protein YkoI